MVVEAPCISSSQRSHFYRSGPSSYTVSPRLASPPKLSLVPQEDDVLSGASGLLGDPALMAKLEDVAMVQVSGRHVDLASSPMFL